MKKLILLSSALSILMFSGCSSKLEPTFKNTKKLESIDYKNYLKKTELVPKNKVEVPKVINQTETETIDAIPSPMDTHYSNETFTTGTSSLSSIYFGYDQYELTENMYGILGKNVELMKKGKFIIQGNCDEFGSDEYNVALGLKRANEVKKALVNYGINPASISLISYGESNPVCTEKTEKCFAKNRRVDFVKGN